MGTRQPCTARDRPRCDLCGDMDSHWTADVGGVLQWVVVQDKQGQVVAAHRVQVGCQCIASAPGAAPCDQAQSAQARCQKQSTHMPNGPGCAATTPKASTARHHRRHMDAQHHGRSRVIWGLSRVGRSKKSLLLTYPTTKFLTTPVNMALGGIGISFRRAQLHFVV